MKPHEIVNLWAQKAHVRFVSRSHGQATTDTVSHAALQDLVCAAVEADRAQRVPEIDGEGDLLTIAYLHGLAKGKDFALAPTPAQPAQQEQMEAFLVVDLSRELGVKPSILIRALQAQGIGNYSVNMAIPKSAADAMRRHFKEPLRPKSHPSQ